MTRPRRIANRSRDTAEAWLIFLVVVGEAAGLNTPQLRTKSARLGNCAARIGYKTVVRQKFTEEQRLKSNDRLSQGGTVNRHPNVAAEVALHARPS